MSTGMHQCSSCGYRGPLIVAHSKVLANRFPSLLFTAIALRFIPLLGFVSKELFLTPREACPNCGEHVMLGRWAGPVEPAELELRELRQEHEDKFKKESDGRLIPVLAAVILIVVGLIIWQIT
jgi:hypothetical protein